MGTALILPVTLLCLLAFLLFFRPGLSGKTKFLVFLFTVAQVLLWFPEFVSLELSVFFFLCNFCQAASIHLLGALPWVWFTALLAAFYSSNDKDSEIFIYIATTVSIFGLGFYLFCIFMSNCSS
jgi:hypothetical protein